MKDQELSKDFKEFVELLNSHQVNYLIVGAWAVAIHGEPRLTGDLDIFVESNEQNASRLIDTLKDFGFGSLNISKDDFLKLGQVIQLGYKPNRIDILTSISGVTFEEAWASRITVAIGSLTLPFLGREALIKNKLASGREKDLQDVATLKRIGSKGF